MMTSKNGADGFGSIEKIPFKEESMFFALPFAMCIAGPTQRWKKIKLFVKKI